MQKIPEVSFKIPKQQFYQLIEVLRYKMNEFLINMEEEEEDAYEQSLFEHNYWLLKQWIRHADRHIENTFTVKLDIMYAKTFIVYWRPIELPQYEHLIMLRIMAELDRGLANIEHKRKTKQL